MYSNDRQRMKDRIACDMLQESGVDMLLPVKELMKMCPNMTEKDARTAVSRWLMYEYRREQGLRSKLVMSGELPKQSVMTEFEDFAPIGKVRCYDKCDWGKITIGEVEVECETCKGVGFLTKGE